MSLAREVPGEGPDCHFSKAIVGFEPIPARILGFLIFYFGLEHSPVGPYWRPYWPLLALSTARITKQPTAGTWVGFGPSMSGGSPGLPAAHTYSVVHWQLGILIFPVFGRFSTKLGPETPLERRGSSCSAGCSKIQGAPDGPRRGPGGAQGPGGAIRAPEGLRRGPGGAPEGFDGARRAPEGPSGPRRGPGGALRFLGTSKSDFTVLFSVFIDFGVF